MRIGMPSALTYYLHGPFPASGESRRRASWPMTPGQTPAPGSSGIQSDHGLMAYEYSGLPPTRPIRIGRVLTASGIQPVAVERRR